MLSWFQSCFLMPSLSRTQFLLPRLSHSASLSGFINLALLLAVGAACLPAQTSTGEVDIRVLDSSGAIIPSAQVQLLSPETGSAARSLTTNESGVAAATFLQPGTYNVVASAPGFQKLNQTGVVVRVGETVTLSLTLNPGHPSPLPVSRRWSNKNPLLSPR